MNVTIYNEPCGGAIGGCEVSVAVLAEALSLEHNVEIVHYRPSMTRETLAKFADTDLSRVELRLGPQLERQEGVSWKVASRYLKEKEQEKRISEKCDVFITFNHEAPVFCAASLGILVVLFPFTTPDAMVPDNSDGSLSATMRKWSQRKWYRWKLGSRLRGYQVRLAISEFSRRWTKERWGTDSRVVFPPVDVKGVDAKEKENCILSVGRFAVGGHSKKQMEMLEAFSELSEVNGSRWTYDCVGACGTSAAEVKFFEEARTLGSRHGARVSANLDRAQLQELYRSASIFWHATGMDVDEGLYPEQTEHFGITTVEAMAAGCVPVVINKGAQPEIVEHGVSGFVWNTLEELRHYTSQLQNDNALRRKMSMAAQVRSQKFSRKAFVAQFKAILDSRSSRASLLPGLANSGAS